MRQNKPKVSVIVPTYNRAKYICEAINSVLNQSFKDLEIVVVDDGSTDNTKEVLYRYGNKIKYFYKKNGGQGSATNFGIRQAKGEVIAFLDSDDLWLPEKLAIQVDILRENENIDMVYTAMSVIDENGNLTGEIKPTKLAKKICGFLNGGRIPMTVVLKKEVFYKYGFFDESMKVAQDTDLWLRFSETLNIVFINKTLAQYRRHNNNKSADTENIHLSHVHTYNKVIPYPDIKPKVQTKLAKAYYLLAKEQYIKGKYKNSLKSSYNAIKNFPLLGTVFTKPNDSILTKIYKITKPYIVLCVYCINFLLFKQGNKIKSNKLNILYFEPSSGFGGSGNSLFNLLSHIDKNKFRPIVVTFKNGPQFEKIKKLGLKLVKLNSKEIESEGYKGIYPYFKFGFTFLFNDLPLFLKMVSVIKKCKIDLVHINTNIISGIPAILASKVTGKPCICHIRQVKKPILRERLFVRWIEKFIVTNQKTKEIYKKYVSENKIAQIYNGVDLEEFSNIDENNFRKELNLNSSPVIGLIGRIVKGKGHREYILTAKEVLKAKPSSKFIIVGDSIENDSGYYKEIKKLVIQENLGKNVIFTGWRNDIKNVISGLDVLVQASIIPEGFGRTVIEAMALNKPVVATNMPGPSEIVVDEETGFLVPLGNINKMAEKVTYLLSNSEIAKKMGENGRKRVEELFDIKKIVREIEESYNSLLRRNKHR